MSSRPGQPLPRAHQSGFIPGVVIEINIAIVVALVLVGILLPASQSKFKPVAIELPNVVELKGVHQSNPFASTTSTGTHVETRDCSGTVSRGVSTNFSATGSFVYTVMAARSANASPTISPTAATSTMNRRLTDPATMVALAGYLVANSNTTISWTMSGCWSTAGVGVAVRRASGG